MKGKELEEVKEAKEVNEVKEDKVETKRDANRAGKSGWRFKNTKKYSTKVNFVSITFLIAFEWNCKTLKREILRSAETSGMQTAQLAMLAQTDHARLMVSLRVEVQGWRAGQEGGEKVKSRQNRQQGCWRSKESAVRRALANRAG